MAAIHSHDLRSRTAVAAMDVDLPNTDHSVHPPVWLLAPPTTHAVGSSGTKAHAPAVPVTPFAPAPPWPSTYGVMAVPSAKGSATTFYLPNAQRTPGKVLTKSLATISVPHYADHVRRMPLSEKRAVAQSYGYTGSSADIRYDHLIPLELGGSNVMQNVWPQPLAQSKIKDGLEDHVRSEVFKGHIPLTDAQKRFAENWVQFWIDSGHPGHPTPSPKALRSGKFIFHPYQAEVTPELRRGSAVNARQLAVLQQHGYRAIINLQKEKNTDEATCARLGLHYLHIPLVDNTVPSMIQVKQFLDYVTAPAHQPTYVHCAAGVGRTGVMVACYRMAVSGWSLDQARTEALHYQMHIPIQSDFLVAFDHALHAGQIPGYPRAAPSHA